MLDILMKRNINRKEFKYQLSITCIAKNEGEYIKEWVEYHLTQGID